MSDQEDKMVRSGDDGVEQRSLATDAAILATPVVVAAQPVIGAWANQHFSKPQDPPPVAEKPSSDRGQSEVAVSVPAGDSGLRGPTGPGAVPTSR